MCRSIALFCFTVLAVGAQTIDATSGPWSATLDGTWRWHVGDDMRWASPSFDDSDWPALRVPGPLPEVEPERKPYWIRLHLETGAISDPGLLLGDIGYAYEVYWDGRRIGQFGDLSHGTWFVPGAQIFPIPAHLATSGAHAVAVRIGQIGGAGGRTHAWRGDSRVGDLAALRDAHSTQMHARLQPWLLDLLINFGFLLAGLYFFWLPPSISQAAAFRWLGVILLSHGLYVMCLFYSIWGPVPIPGGVLVAFVYPFGWAAFIGVIEFSYALFRRRVPMPIRCLECLIATLAAPWPIPYSAWFARDVLILIPPAVAVALASSEFRRRTADAGFTLVLIAIFGATTLYNSLADLSAFYHVWLLKTQINIAGSWLLSWDLIFLLWVPGITIQIHRSNLRFRDERERLHGEMEAARHVQEFLLPSRLVQAPGFEIDVSYQPANEVGGDFFELFPASSDSLLVVVGDVSGKGMKAALLVSLIVGALQNRKSARPATVLAELNAALLGRSEGGFTTCSCALFTPEGSLTIANAGHLAPYRNGEEVAVPPGLPLGINADANWTEHRIELEPGDRVLWMSDGVIEARNGKGDLLGFQRAQELATRSASEIARAARQFGQEDDITVVSVTHQPVPVYAA